MKKVLLLAATTLALTLMLAFAAAAGQAATPGVTDDTILLGTFTALSGPVAPIGVPNSHGYLAYYNYINEQGGIYGRKIKVLVEDDAFQPSRAVAAVKKLVEQDRVFAIVSPLGTPTNAAVLDYLVKMNVPVVSPHSGSSQWSIPLKKNYFALQPNYTVEGTVLAQYAVNDLKGKRFAIVYVNDDYGQEESAAFTKYLAKHNIKPVLSLAHEFGETDFSSYVIKLQQAKPDVVLLASYATQTASILKQAEMFGFRPSFLGTYVVSDPVMFKLAGASAMEGFQVTGYAADPGGDTKAAKEYRDILHKYYPNEAPGGYSEIGYVAAQLVVEALKRAGPDLTREKFIAALESIKNWTTGLTPPVSYSATDHRGIKTFAIAKAKGGQWTIVKESIEVED